MASFFTVMKNTGTVWAVTKLQVVVRVEYTSWTLVFERLFMSKLVIRNVGSCSSIKEKGEGEIPGILDIWNAGCS